MRPARPTSRPRPQAAEALRPIAGDLAFLLFSLGIIGTGLLAVPVLAGSAAYAIGESRGWKIGLEHKPREAVGFYSVIGLATLLGLAVDYSPIDPIKALFWTAVLNGVISVPIMAAMMIVVSRRHEMGPFIATLGSASSDGSRPRSWRPPRSRCSSSASVHCRRLIDDLNQALLPGVLDGSGAVAIGGGHDPPDAMAL